MTAVERLAQVIEEAQDHLLDVQGKLEEIATGITRIETHEELTRRAGAAETKLADALSDLRATRSSAQASTARLEQIITDLEATNARLLAEFRRLSADHIGSTPPRP